MPESQDWNGLWNVRNSIHNPQYRSPVRKPNDPIYSQFISSTGYELTSSWENLVLSRQTALFLNSFPSTSYFQKMLLKKRVKQCHKLYLPCSLETSFKALSKLIWPKQTNNNYNQNKQTKVLLTTLLSFVSSCVVSLWDFFNAVKFSHLASSSWIIIFAIMPLWPFRFIWVQIVLSSL